MTLGVYLLDWASGYPWGAVVAYSEAEALMLAYRESMAMMGPDACKIGDIRVTGRIEIGGEVQPTYYPSMWRWFKPG